jgi:acyl-coenzyme A thioesterase PaaI-like protein
MAGDPNRFMFTGRLTTRYRNPAPLGVPLRLVGKVLRERGKVAECAATLFGPDDEIIAEAEGLLMQVPDAVLENTNFDGMRWEVNPD